MKHKSYQFEYQIHENLNDLSEIDNTLIQKSIEAAQQANAAYSNFRVGAAVLLENGEIYIGSNQENASYPVGICAERTLISYVHANFPHLKKIKLAVSVLDTDKSVSACGMCRQFLLEYETLQQQKIELIFHNPKAQTLVVPSVSSLLPLHFDSDAMN